MSNTYTFRNVTVALRQLCADVMTHGNVVPSRNGKTRELTHVQITLTEPLERYLDLPGRNHSPVAQIAETMWVLAGRNDVEWLSHYLPRAPLFSDNGITWRGGYGPRIRAWKRDIIPYGDTDVTVDQLKHVIELLKKDRWTRRAIIALYDPAVDTEPGKDIPCNDLLHFLPRGNRLDLAVKVRSNDLMWGWSGINAFEWSVLLEIVARLAGFQVGNLVFEITSLHLYEQHWDRALKLADQDLPTSYMRGRPYLGTSLEMLDADIKSWFEKEYALRTGEGDQNLNGLWSMDGMFREWAERVSAKWAKERQPASPPLDPFVEKLAALHTQKHAAYGDSWMKRGELFSIIPNIARKVDRLASGRNTDDETQADTAADLFVYLAKYRLWLVKHEGAPMPVGMTHDLASLTTTPQPTNQLLGLVKPAKVNDAAPLVESLGISFERLLFSVEHKDTYRYRIVDGMLQDASALARVYAS